MFEIHVKLDKFKTGKGYPKVKNSLYCDPDFVSKISEMISETTLAKVNENPENTLDLILFNTQTIAQQHSQELRKQQSKALEYLNLEIKTVEAQLDAMTLQKTPAQSQLKYLNKLQNKLSQLKIELNVANEQAYSQTYLAELEKDLLNPQKP